MSVENLKTLAISFMDWTEANTPMIAMAQLAAIWIVFLLASFANG